jgi:hypothetical protein
MAPDHAGTDRDALEIQWATSLEESPLLKEHHTKRFRALRRGSLVLLAGMAVGRVVALSDASSTPSDPQAGAPVLKATLADSTIAISASTNDVSGSSGVKLDATVDPVVSADGASVTTTSAAGAPPAGAVTWTVTSTTTGQTVPCASETTALESNGNASCKIAPDELSAAASPYTATVSYAGDSTFAASTQTLTLPVSKTDTRTRLSLTPPAQPGSPASLTATVSGVGSDGDPTGTLNFFISSPAGTVPCDGGTNSFTLSSGAATCQLDLAPLAQGWHYRVETTYSGDDNFNPNSCTGGWQRSHQRRHAFGISTTTTTSPPDTTSTGPTAPSTITTTGSTGTGPTTTQPSSSGGEMAAPTGYTAGQMTVDDTFSGTSLDSSDWTPQVAPGSVWNDEDLPAGDSSAGSNQAAYWTPGQVSVDNGLTLTARQTIPSDAGSSKGFNWVSGAITSKFTLPSTGWYVQIRAQMPDTSDGMWPALWFLPSSSAQEFDGLEGGWPGSSPNEQGHSDLFDSSGQDQAVWPTPGGTDITSGYNTYGFRYIPGQSATVYFNGQQVYQDSDSNISSEAYYLIIELQVASSATSGWHTALSANTPSPSNMNISEVQVYS